MVAIRLCFWLVVAGSAEVVAQTPTRTPSGAFAVDEFERAALGSNWVQFDSEHGPNVDWGSVSINAAGHAAQGSALSDAVAYYTAFIPTANTAYACIKSGGVDTRQNACACLGVDNATNDGLCCCLKNEGGPPNEWEMFGWDGNTAPPGFINPELSTLAYSVGDFIGIRRTSANTFRCAHATAAAPTTWNDIGVEHLVANITNPGFGGVYFYNDEFLAEQFEVGDGSTLPTTHVCGAVSGSPTGTPTVMAMLTATATLTSTPTRTSTRTPTQTSTATLSIPTSTPPDTPSPSQTATATRTPTSSPTLVLTATSTRTPTGGAPSTPTRTSTHTPTGTRTETATPPPTPAVSLNSIPAPIVIGAQNTVTGSGFSAGSVVVMFVAIGSGAETYGPFAPTTRSPTTLTFLVPASVPVGNGFCAVLVVNTDDGFIASNAQAQLLYAAAGAGFPTITALNGVALTPPDLSVPLANVSTVVAQNSTLTVEGTGFSSPVVVLYSSNPTAAALEPLAGGSSTQVQVVVPAGIPTGPGALQVLNRPSFTGSGVVSAPIGERIRIDTVTQLETTITVKGAGFSVLTVISFYNAQPGGVVNLGGLVNGTQSLIPFTLVSPQELTFQVPAGAISGPSYIQALNPPFLAFTSTGNSPNGAIIIAAP